MNRPNNLKGRRAFSFGATPQLLYAGGICSSVRIYSTTDSLYPSMCVYAPYPTPFLLPVTLITYPNSWEQELNLQPPAAFAAGALGH